MKIGGPIFEKYNTPDEWIYLLKKEGYDAAYCPVDLDAKEEIVKEYAEESKKEGIIIAEVGTWCNPLIDDKKEKERNLLKCKKGLYLADKIGAKCCVNIAGSRSKKWDGPDEKNLTKETFDMIVDTVREIIDDVQPKRTFYTLETMPWIYPNSAESYLKLIKAIDRKKFAVHFDPVNLINSVEKYYLNGYLIKDFIRKLGKYIKSCHAKDIILRENPILHLDEVRPGEGNLNYKTFLKEINKLDRDLPIMLEHLKTPEEYRIAKKYILSIMKEVENEL